MENRIFVPKLFIVQSGRQSLKQMSIMKCVKIIFSGGISEGHGSAEERLAEGRSWFLKMQNNRLLKMTRSLLEEKVCHFRH